MSLPLPLSPSANQTNHFCYILVNASKRNTYAGYTVNPARRIRQHRGELAGGAKYTSRYGPSWEFTIILTSLSPGWTNKKALSAEWHLKPHTKADRSKRGDPMERRIDLLKRAFNNVKFTDFTFEIFVSASYFTIVEKELIHFIQLGRVTLYHTINDLQEKIKEESVKTNQSRSAPGPASPASASASASASALVEEVNGAADAAAIGSPPP